MTQRVYEWSLPWVQEPDASKPINLPWGPPWEPAMDSTQQFGSTAWSVAFPYDDNYYVPTTPGTDVPAWADPAIMGFYAGQPTMLSEVQPGVGGMGRALIKRPSRAPLRDLLHMCQKDPGGAACLALEAQSALYAFCAAEPQSNVCRVLEVYS
jgi:hypothetical protein